MLLRFISSCSNFNFSQSHIIMRFLTNSVYLGDRHVPKEQGVAVLGRELRAAWGIQSCLQDPGADHRIQSCLDNPGGSGTIQALPGRSGRCPQEDSGPAGRIQALPGRSRRCPQDAVLPPRPSAQEAGTEEPEGSAGGGRGWFNLSLFFNIQSCFNWEEMTFPQWSLSPWDLGE